MTQKEKGHHDLMIISKMMYLLTRKEKKDNTS